MRLIIIISIFGLEKGKKYSEAKGENWNQRAKSPPPHVIKKHQMLAPMRNMQRFKRFEMEQIGLKSLVVGGGRRAPVIT